MKKLSILWITDIHFRGKYAVDLVIKKSYEEYSINAKKPKKDKNSPEYLELKKQFEEEVQNIENTYKKILNPFIDSFFKTIKNDYKGNIDYIILSGDLAFSATKADYAALDEYFLKKLKETFSEIPILTIPGNHDVNWEKIEGIPSLFDDLQTFEDRISKKNVFLTKNKDKFKNLFNAYTEYTKKLWEVPKSDTDIVISDDYKEGRLFGHLIDRKNKVIFILLNTAWFSLGGKGRDKMIEAYKNNEKKLLKVYKTFEKGEQIIGRDLLNEQIFTDLDEHSDYRVATIMHHNLSYLDWGELYTYKKVNALKLQNIIAKSDVLLTGHEHLPLNVKAEKIGNTYYFKGGMFLQDEIKLDDEAENFQCSRFSILEIEGDKLKEIKFHYNFISNSQKHFWKKIEEEEVYDLQPKENKIKYLKKEITIENTKATITKLLSFTLDEIKNITPPKNKQFYFFSIERDNKSKWLIIVPRVDDFYGKGYGKDAIKAEIDKEEPAYVNFFVLDQKVSADLNLKYKDKDKEDIASIFGKIQELADRAFDTNRYNFFNEEGTVLKHRKISFMNQIVPFWKWNDK